MRGGGTAGGGKKENNFEVVKSTPRFIAEFKQRYADKDAKISDKYFDKSKFRPDGGFDNAMDVQNDLASAAIVEGAEFLEAKVEADKIEAEHQKAEEERKDFKPTFISRKKEGTKPPTDNNSQAKDSSKKEKDEKSAEGAKPKVNKLGNAMEKYLGNSKKLTEAEAEESGPRKKVKGSLLSFDEI